jgi:hypothetical protein
MRAAQAVDGSSSLREEAQRQDSAGSRRIAATGSHPLYTPE